MFRRVPATNSPTDFRAPYRERNQVLKLTDSGGFTDRSPAETAFSGPPGVSHSLVRADFDNDGARLLLVTQMDGPARLFRNTGGCSKGNGKRRGLPGLGHEVSALWQCSGGEERDQPAWPAALAVAGAVKRPAGKRMAGGSNQPSGRPRWRIFWKAWA